MTPREAALLLPEIVVPDWPTRFAALGKRAIQWLRETPGVIGAWIEVAALTDSTGAEEVTMLVLMDEGREVSDAFDCEGVTLAVAGVSFDILSDTLEIDAEFVSILANAYRLCGVENEVFELEALASEIAGA